MPWYIREKILQMTASHPWGISPEQLTFDLISAYKFPKSAIRDIISQLWDEGEIQLSSDRKLKISVR